MQKPVPPITVMQGFAIEEGFYDGPSFRPFDNKNPLDLRWGAEAKAFGALHGDRPPQGTPADFEGSAGMAVFPDFYTGWTAGVRWLSIPAKFDHAGNLVGGYLGASFEKVIMRFAPPEDHNDTAAYIAGFCKSTGLTPDTILTADLLTIPQNPQTGV